MTLFQIHLLPPLLLMLPGFLLQILTTSEVIRGYLFFGISDPIHNYNMDCEGVLVYT
jgi:hypothetical protein